MKLTHKFDNNILIVNLIGKIMVANSEYKENLFDMLDSLSFAGCILNFQHVEHIDSYGLGILILLERKLRHRGVPFSLCELPHPIQKTIEITNLETLLHVEKNAKSAKNYVEMFIDDDM